METKSIVCFTESMAGGGAEHQMSFLANFLVEKGYNVSPGLRVAVDKSIDNQEFIKFRGKVNHKDFDIYNKETDETEKTMAILAIVHLKASEDISRVANDFWYALSNGNDYTIPIKKR